MKIQFINAPLNSSALEGEWDLASVNSVSPPLGLLHLSSLLKQRGHQVDLVDADCHPTTAEEYSRRFRAFMPDIVGISFMTGSFNSATKFARLVKAENAAIPVIAGGAHVSALPRETLQRDCFDIGVLGEGEETLAELVDVLAAGKTPDTVRGIVYRDASGKSVLTEPRPLLPDLDVLPQPDWPLIRFADYRLCPIGIMGKVAVPLTTTRGCPGRCTFCSNNMFGRKVRGHSAAYVLDMMQRIIRDYGIREFLFYDDTFVALRKRVFEICEGMLRLKLHASWTCCARVNCVTEDMLKIMRRAGCWQIEYGIESGCQEILERVNKRITLDQVRNAMRWTRQAGIQTRGNFIFGLPGDTVATIERTIDFACSLDLDFFQQSYLSPYPGTAVFEEIRQLGEFKDDWDQMSDFIINFVPHGLTRDDMVRLSSKAFRRFYLRPRTVLTHFRWLCRHPRLLYNYSRAAGAFLKTVIR